MQGSVRAKRMGNNANVPDYVVAVKVEGVVR